MEQRRSDSRRNPHYHLNELPLWDHCNGMNRASKVVNVSRTEEQIKADENLTEAIDQCIRAYGYEEDFILTDYMVIAAQVKLDEDGDTVTAYSYLYRDSDLPYHKILGLMEVARRRAAYHMMQGEDDL